MTIVSNYSDYIGFLLEELKRKDKELLEARKALHEAQVEAERLGFEADVLRIKNDEFYRMQDKSDVIGGELGDPRGTS